MATQKSSTSKTPAKKTPAAKTTAPKTPAAKKPAAKPTKKQLEKIVHDSYLKIADTSTEDFKKALQKHADSDGNIPVSDLVLLAYQESARYSRDLLLDVLGQIL